MNNKLSINANQELTAALEIALQGVSPGLATVVNLRRLTGGASAETWSFDLVSNEQTTPLILRRSSVVSDSEFFVAIDKTTEAQVQFEANAAGVSAPKVIKILKPEDGLGEGFVMERAEGETIPRKILRDDQYAEARTVMAAQCGEILARIHAIPRSSLPQALSEQSTQRQLHQFYKLYRSFHQPSPTFETAFRWLDDRIAQQQRTTLVHGDFRNGNFIVNSAGIHLVLDWEMAHLGDPMEDLGWLCVNSWRFGQVDQPVGGFGQQEDLFASYEKHSGIKVDPEAVRYWEVFGTLKWGVMCLIQAYSHLNQQRRSVELAAIGRRVSETELDLLNLILPRR